MKGFYLLGLIKKLHCVNKGMKYFYYNQNLNKMEQNNERSLFELSVDAQARSFLAETAKWGKFFAILGFIFCVIIVLVGVLFVVKISTFVRFFTQFSS